MLSLLTGSLFNKVVLGVGAAMAATILVLWWLYSGALESAGRQRALKEQAEAALQDARKSVIRLAEEINTTKARLAREERLSRDIQDALDASLAEIDRLATEGNDAADAQSVPALPRTFDTRGIR